MNLASTSLWNFGWIQTHLQWLREKPLCKRAYAQWLLIQKAEEEKLVSSRVAGIGREASEIRDWRGTSSRAGELGGRR